jgi:hypothetical protein
MGKASGQVSFDLLEGLIILEQDVKLFEHESVCPASSETRVKAPSGA